MINRNLSLIFLITFVEILFILFIGYIDVICYRRKCKMRAFAIAFILGIIIICFLIIFLITTYYYGDKLEDRSINNGLNIYFIATSIVIIISIVATIKYMFWYKKC